MSNINKDISFKNLNLKPQLLKFYKRYGKHTAFAVLIVVLLAYLFVVFRISSLANAEPDPSQQNPTSTVIPKINQTTIDHIQSLEDNNPDIHALFDQARNNPFQE